MIGAVIRAPYNIFITYLFNTNCKLRKIAYTKVGGVENGFNMGGHEKPLLFTGNLKNT